MRDHTSCGDAAADISIRFLGHVEFLRGWKSTDFRLGEYTSDHDHGRDSETLTIRDESIRTKNCPGTSPETIGREISDKIDPSRTPHRIEFRSPQASEDISKEVADLIAPRGEIPPGNGGNRSDGDRVIATFHAHPRLS